MFLEEKKNNCMPIKKSIFILFVVMASLFNTTSCKKKNNSNLLDNFYFVKIGNIALPVRVCGKADAEVGIIFIHSGPGSTAQTERDYSYWREIEKNYKVIYYDQRGSGNTQGSVNINTMTLEQFNSDLDIIIDFSRDIAKVTKVFLHGASWGGTLATYYLIDTIHQKKINGVILESPTYDFIHGSQLSINWMLQKADSALSTNTNNAYWQNCKNYYSIHPILTKNDFKQHQNYLNQVKGIIFNTGNTTLSNSSKPTSELSVTYNNAEFAPATLTYQGQSIFTQVDLTAQLHLIKTPILLVWGAKDGLNPRNNLAQKFITNIGTSQITYSPIKYQLSANIPHIEEWQLFNIDAKAFIELYK